MGILLLAMLLTAAGPEVEVQMLDGQTKAGRLAELTESGLKLDTPDGRVALQTAQLMGLTPKQTPAAPDQPPAAWIELVDGSTLVARDYAVQGGKARVTLLDGEAIQIATRDITTVRFQAAADALLADWARILGNKLDGDVVVIRKDESLDYHKGVLKDIDDKSVQFELDGEAVPIKRARVFGLAYYHAANRELPEAVCRLTDATGSQWSVRKLALSERGWWAAGKLQWTTPAGVTVARTPELVARFDFSSGKIIYLSDLKPESVKWTPYFAPQKAIPSLQEFFAPRMDKNLAAKPLQIAGKTYAKGVAMHSRTEMVYRLPGRFSRLEAIAGIDDEGRPNGNVRLVIRGDGKVLFDQTVVGNEDAKPLKLDLSGVRRLTILVDFGEGMDVGDHLDLCNARIIR
jgi:hypothetical protein